MADLDPGAVDNPSHGQERLSEAALQELRAGEAAGRPTVSSTSGTPSRPHTCQGTVLEMGEEGGDEETGTMDAGDEPEDDDEPEASISEDPFNRPISFDPIQGSRHQGDDGTFGDRNAGRQCFPISIVVLAYSRHFAKPHTWTRYTIDELLYCGNEFLNEILKARPNTPHYLELEDCRDVFVLEGRGFYYEQRQSAQGYLSRAAKTETSIPANEAFELGVTDSDGAIVTLGDYSFAVWRYPVDDDCTEWKWCVFDSHARNREGLLDGRSGVATLVFKDTFEDVFAHFKALRKSLRARNMIMVNGVKIHEAEIYEMLATGGDDPAPAGDDDDAVDGVGDDGLHDNFSDIADNAGRHT